MKKKLLITISTGVLLTLVGCSQKALEQPVTNTTKSSEVATTISSEGEQKTSSNQVSITSVEDVIAIYQEQFPDTDITSIQLEKELSGFVYKVEGVDDDNEYELKINAETKEVVKDKTEKLDLDEQGGSKRNSDKLDLEGIISLDEATKIAEEKAGTGQAVEWDLDRELTTTYWEVKVKDGTNEIQVKLDAKTGDILEIEQDD